MTCGGDLGLKAYLEVRGTFLVTTYNWAYNPTYNWGNPHN